MYEKNNGVKSYTLSSNGVALRSGGIQVAQSFRVVFPTLVFFGVDVVWECLRFLLVLTAEGGLKGSGFCSIKM